MNTKNEILKVVVKTVSGTSFVGLRGYESGKNNKKCIETSICNYTFLVGFSLENLLKKDLNKLNSLNITSLFSTDTKKNDTYVKAYNELKISLEKRLTSDEVKEILRANNDSTLNRSDAQKNAYTHIAKGLKYLNIDRQGNNYPQGERPIYIYGLEVRKTVIKKGLYKPTNSQLKTILKNEIIKKCDLQSSLKYRSFKIGNESEIKIQGITI